MAVQQFCLRWNNHQPNFISVFTTLLNNETLVDVTLAAEGKQLQAHKVVLSACSTYFQNLFTTNPCTHPIVILKDIKYSDLKTMVDFMYYGEVNVSQDQLPDILKTAEALKVKGLAEMPEQLSLSKSLSQSSDKCDSPAPTSPSVLRRKRFRKSSTGSGSEQTSEETAASGSGSGTTELVSPNPVKAEPEDSSSLRHDPSTESEPRESSLSVEEEIVTPRNLSEETMESNIRWPSLEDKPGTSQPTQQVVETSMTGSSMGSKRGRLLMRQNRIKKDSELGVDLATSPDPPEPGGHQHLLVGLSRGIIERQSSEPTPSYLSVPVTSHLVKQNSSPHLSYTSSAPSSSGSTSSTTPAIASTSTQVPVVHVQAPSPTESSSLTHTITKAKSEEFRKALSSVECTVTEACEGSRFCHCPVLRPGPALGCNFCWNTIDTHGRILRRKTKYHCPECQTNLCIVPCFQEFHERQGTCRREPAVVQSTSGSSPPPPGGGSGAQQEWTSIIKSSPSL